MSKIAGLSIEINGEEIAAAVRKEINKQIDKLKEDKLLVIELDDEHSIPKVIYKGEEIEGRVHISFEWKTKGEHSGIGGVNLHIEHWDNDTQSVHVKCRKTGEFM